MTLSSLAVLSTLMFQLVPGPVASGTASPSNRVLRDAGSRDTTSADESDVDPAAFRPRLGFGVNPLTLYSGTYGFGLLGYVSVLNLPVPGAVTRVSVWPSQRRQLFMASFRTPSSGTHPVYTHARFRYEINREHRYYGLGPLTDSGNRVNLDRNGLEAELQAGFQPRGRSLLIQPLVRYERHRVLGFDDDTADAFARLNAPSQQAIRFWQDPTTASGLFYGLAVEFDARNPRLPPERGLLAQARFERFSNLGDEDLAFNQYHVAIHGFLPTVNRQLIALRVSARVTRSTGDAPIPFYFLPVVDFRTMPGLRRNRLLGNDALIANLEYRLHLRTFLDWYQLGLTVQANAGQVYEDLFNQFKPSLAFGENVARSGDRVVLRTSLALGLTFRSLDSDRVLLNWRIGYSADTLTIVPFQFSFVYNFRSPQPFYW